MRTFAILYRPKGNKVYTNYYHKSDSGNYIATIHGDINHASEHKRELAESQPGLEFAVFEMIEVTA